MKLSAKQATILLACVISARATSFLFSKLCLVSMNAFSLLALRFSIASILLFMIFHRKIIHSFQWHNLVSGIIIGTIFYFVLIFEHTGLKTTDASTAAFIENLAIIIVPFLECMIHQALPSGKNLLSAFLAIIGVGMITMSGNHIILSTGELFLLAAALSYAIAIIVTSLLTHKGDSFVIGFFQVTTTAVLAWSTVAINGTFTSPQNVPQYIMIALLAIVCTSFGFTLQPVAQSKLTPETAGSFCALGPLVASALSCIFLKESITIFSFCGAICILLSLAIESNLMNLKLHIRKAE